MSLFIAYFSTTLLYQKRIHSSIEETLIKNGQKMIQIYQSTATSADDLPEFMQNFSGFVPTNIQLYNKEGKPLLVMNKTPIHVEDRNIEQVIAGGIARNIVTGEYHLPIIGLPFQVDEEPYALFITVEKNSVDDEIMNSIHLMYVIILLLGSLLILIAARYLVNPILQLTKATKRMAKGKFDFEIQTKRKDEIGVLSTSFKEMANEISKLDRMRQAFVTNVSHEIQSPLTSISGFSKALKQMKMSEESKNRYLTIIEEESERLSRLSQNLLKLSYLQQEQHPLSVSTFRLDEQLRTVVINLEPQWKAKEIFIDVQLQNITIQADEDQLKQVWTNLMSNAIKFTPIHGKISIEAIIKGDYSIVSITDNGIGIPLEEHADIFKPFHKVDKARDPSVKGNGLGLSIVKQIVDIHNGKIQVSGDLGEGSTFKVTLPRSFM
ncbi:HAMP domain-containing sensor histidine kinase [Bacillus sp. FJAT-29790]|uniref:HAMP domain-containing sensor histidine kinase n=1 Tax=Bacillus sp. FJAT-29790 TaxID=1895002 RepID=UPI0020B35FCE|nr:HAMP domain-containing sensor histidine kinase [Bacillus sp. FJAT-29790]